MLFLLGLPLREMLERFGHKVVQLFKLLLLQKRVLFFHSPVRPLSTCIISLLALFPGLVESGLDKSTAPAESVVVETVEVPHHFIPPPPPGDEIANDPSSDQAEAEANLGLTGKLYALKDKLVGNQRSAATVSVPVTTGGTDTTDDKISRESSFEDLRAPTVQEMENEVLPCACSVHHLCMHHKR